MKKNGFTLVEVLAILVIMGILALIFVPLITGIISDSKKNAAKRSLEGYVRAVDNAQMNYETENGGKHTNKISDLEIDIDDPSKIGNANVLFDANGSVKRVYAMISGYYCRYIKDTEAQCKDDAFIAGILDKELFHEQYSYAVNKVEFYDDGRNFEGDYVDISESQDLGIRLYNINNNIYIVGDGIIYFPEDSSYLFSLSIPMDYLESINKYEGEYIAPYIDFNEAINTSPVTDMSGMFANYFVGGTCFNQIDNNVKFINNIIDNKINLVTFDTSNVTDMSRMFAGNYNIDYSTLSSFNTSKVENMSRMFAFIYDFCGEHKMNDIDISSLDVSSFDTSKVTDMSYMFAGITNSYLNLENFDTSNVINMDRMFSQAVLGKINLNSFNTKKVTSMESMFSHMGRLSELDLSSFKIDNVIDISYMFYRSASLTSIIFEEFNTNKITNMRYMFSNCVKLVSLDLSSWNTAKVTDMNSMFYQCYELKSLNLENFDTSNVTDMEYMFSNCRSLTSLDLSNFETPKLTSMDFLFSGCSRLTNLNISKINTSNVRSMIKLFGNCISLVSLDLSSFNTQKLTSTGYSFNIEYGMFYNCSNLTTIYVSNSWNMNSVSSYGGMFYNCVKLPNFNSSVIGKTNANTSSTGYLTLKV